MVRRRTAYPELASLIRRRREQLGLTQRFVAERIGISQSTLVRWECGNRTPSGPAFERLRQYLRFSDDELAAATALPS